MSSHHCHALECKAPCPPKWLFCRPHWALVPKPLQDEVYRTVVLRGRDCDETWGPWWRAQAEAIAHVAVAEGIRSPEWKENYLDREHQIADELEGIE